MFTSHMTREFEDFHGDITGDKYLVHVRWLAERYERMNEQLLNLSGTFIGFLAIELGLIAQVNHEFIRNNTKLFQIGISAVFLLVVAIVSFFICLSSNKFKIPNLEMLQGALDIDEEELKFEPIRLMLSSEKSNYNIQESLEDENSFINRFYKIGLRAGILGQVVIGFFIYSLWR